MKNFLLFFTSILPMSNVYAVNLTSPMDGAEKAYTRSEYSQPKLEEAKKPSDKNFSYYSYRRFNLLATAFLNWMNTPNFGHPPDESTVRMGTEFRGYVLAHLERTDVEWRNRCNTQELEIPNEIVRQIATIIVSDPPTETDDWSDNSITTIALAKAVFTRCMDI